jgi:hypothetical protein
MRENHWSVAIDSFEIGRLDYRSAVFNGKYQQQFRSRGIPFEFETRTQTAGHMVVSRPHVLSTIGHMSEFEHSVLYLGRSGTNSLGFSTEYDIQRAILLNWARTPFGSRARIISDEFPVDRGPNPRRIDILAREGDAGDWLVVEVKRAEAKIEAVQQIQGYLSALAFRDDPLPGLVYGALVAERVPDAVRAAAAQAGIAAYEIAFPMILRKVA